ncbi:hypothetical protein BE04_12790 [Sorangium cellulosum]|uniref:Secreted protein n=2 Tax=Sorangium cellulosum TaxID=56 RepID=A0A150PUT1_SORCE|nr:hypothetical protein [Sorangium cellulosum]AGP40945.1 hypothetical protein SCE1572_44515 [Sorangium cellulosum So0157-2]KYF59521.1 hypothetical protein BE04_12790 [Sorangium cellulosum]
MLMQHLLATVAALFVLLAADLATPAPKQCTKCVCLDQILTDRGEDAAAQPNDEAIAELRSRLRGAGTKRVLVQSPEQIKAVRAAVADDALVLLQRSKNPDPALATLGRVPDHVSVAHAVPRTRAEVTGVYGPEVNASEVSNEYLAQLRRKAGALHNERTRVLDLTATMGTTAAERALRHIDSQQPGHLTIVIGHTDAQGLLRFADGSSVPIAALFGISADGSHGDIWVISCNTLKHVPAGASVALATGRSIPYEDGLDLAKLLVDTVGRQRKSYEVALRAMQKNPKLSFAIGLVGTGLIFAPADSGDEDG